ncbi:Periplasmic protein TonB [Magnetospirillum sp. XM-1]|uniref:energy transducer TonB n=1 Tax=Magnetospirillum sp. XM-1 TaxID=1663591 RepID=UPI00073DEB83|nr:energy transducer TonB [Magnetospirillum sp. XM-1]CUW41464.1 Periplasmic protein TonB [Magnetospirillum sp. XM-1]
MYAARRQSSSKRLAGLAGVVALHAAAIYALANGLGHCAVEILKAPLEAKVVAELIKPPEPPKVEPPPPPKAVKPPPPAYVPPPKTRVQAPPPAAITAVTQEAPVAPPPPVVIAPVAAEPPPVKVQPALDQGRPCKPPQYPPAARRAEETGAVVLKFLIDTDGSVMESVVEATSGFERLDEAARQALALCRFKPGTTDGRPERSWARIRYVWKLQ